MSVILSQFIDTAAAANDPDNWNQILLLTRYDIPYIPGLIASYDDHDTSWADE